MDRKKLDKLRSDLSAARNAPQTAGDLRSLALRAGRRERSGGKHSMWVTDWFPRHRPFPIPTHANKAVSIGVRKVVLSVLEADAAALEDMLNSREDVEGREDD